jgi:glutamyl endopeptidase
MPTEVSPSVLNKHARVSNWPMDEFLEATGEAVLQAPSLGKPDTTGVEVSGDSEFAATGWALKEVGADGWTVPDMSGLRNIREASIGSSSPSPETVIGPDDRVQITHTASHPWRMIAFLLITAADNSNWIDTGWFIGPHTLMTVVNPFDWTLIRH